MREPLRPPSRAVAAPLLAMVLAGLVLASAAEAAAASITLEAHALVDGRYEAGGWAAVSVSLVNEGAPIDGYLAADHDDGTVRRRVELPAGARKHAVLYLRPAPFARSVEVRFEDEDGRRLAAASADLRVLERTTSDVAVIGDGAGNLRPQLIERSAGIPEPLVLSPADLPDRPEPLRGIEAMVWAGDSGSLTQAQRRTIERWVASGGHLVVLGGPDWQGRTAAFEALLPLSDLASADGSSPAGLAAWAGSPPPDGVGRMTVTLGTLRPGAVELIPDANRTLAAAITRGAGRVAFLGADLATEPFRAWPGAGGLWARLVPDDRFAEQWGGTGPLDEEGARLMTQALGNLPALEVPPAELLLGVIVAYILLIGPGSYLVLRRLDRRELAWVTAPILVLIFSAGSYGIGASMKGSQVIVNEVSVVRATNDGTAASVSTYAGVFSPARATYDVRVAADALLSGLHPNGSLDEGSRRSYLSQQGNPARLQGLSVGVFGLQSVRAEAVLPYRPALSVTWSLSADGLVGAVTNNGSDLLEDVAVVSFSGGVMVGDLAPGASRDFRLARRTANGSSASQEVYGFGRSDPSSDAERREFTRRVVIDALVGEGGQWGEIDTTFGGVDRGPFAIGWRPAAAPLAVELEGETVERYSTTVEVISGRPQLGPGSVELAPTQLSVDLVSTEGEASSLEGGWVSVANGGAVFRLSLPLEVTGLAPSEVVLLAGNDPVTVAESGTRNVGGMLPNGYRLAVFDTRAGEWEDVGDLSQGSRFNLDDPGRVIDDAGRILVRVTGTDIPRDFGEIPVFVSASINGQL